MDLSIFIDAIKLQDLNHDVGILCHESHNLVIFEIPDLFGSLSHVAIWHDNLVNGWVRKYWFAVSSHDKLDQHEDLLYAHQSVSNRLLDQVESRL